MRRKRKKSKGEHKWSRLTLTITRTPTADRNMALGRIGLQLLLLLYSVSGFSPGEVQNQLPIPTGKTLFILSVHSVYKNTAWHFVLDLSTKCINYSNIKGYISLTYKIT